MQYASVPMHIPTDYAEQERVRTGECVTPINLKQDGIIESLLKIVTRMDSSA